MTARSLSLLDPRPADRSSSSTAFKSWAMTGAARHVTSEAFIPSSTVIEFIPLAPRTFFAAGRHPRRSATAGFVAGMVERCRAGRDS